MAFSCELCSMEFPTEGGLQIHMNIFGTEHAKCPECSFVAITQQNVDFHRIQNHFRATPSRDTTTSHPQAVSRRVRNILRFCASQQEQVSASNQSLAMMASHPTNGPITWTFIPTSRHTEALTELRQLVHSIDVLRRQHYLRRSEETPMEFDYAPRHSPFAPKRHAVALDCEMVGSRDETGKEHSVLARLSVLDYLTGEVIIDALVHPEMQVTDWRTRYSGVTRAAMNAAIINGQALRGVQGARRELWKYVDQETVIVGQSLKNDFDALRIVHLRAVDCGIVVAEAVGIPTQPLFGLKHTCADLLGIQIQQGGNLGHDSVEDSLAAREVVLFCLNETEKLETWAKARRAEHAVVAAKRALRLAQDRAERIAALDQKRSWSREIMEEAPTKEELKKPTVRLPYLPAPIDWRARRRELFRKKLEMWLAPREASWESTISRSREPLLEPSCDKSMYEVRLPPSTQPMFSNPTSQESSRSSLQDASLAGIGKGSTLEAITEEVTTVLDDSLADSEISRVIKTTIPSSPSSASTL